MFSCWMDRTPYLIPKPLLTGTPCINKISAAYLTNNLYNSIRYSLARQDMELPNTWVCLMVTSNTVMSLGRIFKWLI